MCSAICVPHQFIDSTSLQHALWTIWAVRVDVDIDVLNAALRLCVTRTRDPRSIMERCFTDFRQEQATPLSTGRQTGFAPACELKGQSLLPSGGVPENDRTNLTRISVIHAGDRSLHAHGLLEQPVNGASHGSSHVPPFRGMPPPGYDAG